jgi:Flp pilus assembly pilin Flp
MAIGLHYGRIVTQRRSAIASGIAQFGMDDSGADLIEYVLIAGVVAGGCVLTLTELRNGIIAFFSSLIDNLPADLE